MKKLTSLKNKTLNRKGFLLLGDILLPIATKGMVEIRQAMKDITDGKNFPIKVVQPDDKEKQAMKSFGFDTNKLNIVVRRIDETSQEYKDFQKEMDRINLFIKIAVNIDMEYEVEDGLKVWEDLELESSKDYLGMAKWLSGLGMVEKEQEIALKTIDAIKASNFKEYEDIPDNLIQTYDKYLVNTDEQGD